MEIIDEKTYKITKTRAGLGAYYIEAELEGDKIGVGVRVTKTSRKRGR